MRNLCVPIILCLFSCCCNAALEPVFDAIVVPSIADREMDYWFLVPLNSGPAIPKTKTAYRNQLVSLIIFCNVQPVESQTQVDIAYDLKIYSTKKVVMNEPNITFYKGEMPKGLLLPQTVVDVAFDENDPFEPYHIEAVLHERISKRNCTAKETIELIPFASPKAFTSQEEYGQWSTDYYRKPDPVRSLAGILQYVQTDDKWIKGNYSMPMLAFYRHILLDNRFLWEYLSQLYSSVSETEKKRILLVAAVTPCKERDDIFANKIEPNLRPAYDHFLKIRFPNTDGELTMPVQLDILWSEFFATGKYKPISRLVSALALQKYEGTLDKIKKKELDMTDDVRKLAMLDATYQSVMWSLTSNCQQHLLVHQYCQTIYDTESLKPEIKKKLGIILYTVKKKKERKE